MNRNFCPHVVRRLCKFLVAGFSPMCPPNWKRIADKHFSPRMIPCPQVSATRALNLYRNQRARSDAPCVVDSKDSRSRVRTRTNPRRAQVRSGEVRCASSSAGTSRRNRPLEITEARRTRCGQKSSLHEPEPIQNCESHRSARAIGYFWRERDLTKRKLIPHSATFAQG